MRRAGQTQSQPARLNETYCPGDRIQVGDKSRADVALVNQPVLRLDQNTNITLAALKEGRASLVELVSGAIHFFSRLPRNLEINTAFVNAGVEGTEGLVQVEADRTIVTIFEGKVLAANAAGSLPLTDGQSAVAEKGKSPVLRTVVRPRDAVQWALYYPPVTYFRAVDFQGPEPWRGMVQHSIDAYIKGDYQAAFETIKGVPSDIREPRLFAYRAQLLLGVGRVDEASKDISQALSINSNDSGALALQSIIAVVQNDKERALSVAQKAVAVDPKSASALTALSYAQQANFALKDARNSLQQAVQANPSNALAWARLAELHMSVGNLDEALEAAQKAVALDPDLSRTQMVLGFAQLLRVNTSGSKAAFEKAIALDQADSLSRLGLGLAKIREGALEEGRKEIEIAASLDPNNAIVRSYLGKSYYEEKRTQLTDREYAIAKELDPKDPTPYFYDAIQKQTTNRPVEALQDIQKALELNDNRAVYRSRLQLDSDLAARSASLARIYTDMGFQQLALVEGWKSVNTDPTNFSAHRFLADSYSALPRHEIARVSELLQSQLLQPLNMTPIQPRLAESNLFLLSAIGPGLLSFNEFNPIFNRDGITFHASGIGGEHETFAGEGVLSGIYKKFAFSVGGFHFDTDGWRNNANQRDDIGNAFSQLELSPKTSVQAEYRYRRTTHGDLQNRFFLDDFFHSQQNVEERNTFRIGARHAFSPDSIMLGSFVYQHAITRQRDTQFPLQFGLGVELGFHDVLTKENAYSLEFQHLFRSRYVNLTSGISYAKITGRLHFLLDLLPPVGPFSFRLQDTDIDGDQETVDVYSYATISPLRNLALTLGGSGIFLHGSSESIADEGDVKQFNPKFGITWEPIAGTTLRMAAFRNLKRTLSTNQTLEPTQVAGFNQFFDEAAAVQSWRYGAAIDQKFTQNIFGGAEISHRDNLQPVITISTKTTRRTVVTEDLARAYLFWTPHAWVALRADYLYERFKNELVLDNQPFTLQTHRVPLGISLFLPSGLSASVTGTYWNQSGKFWRVTDFVVRSGSDDFFTVDAALNYRLPKRYGFITVGATNLGDDKFKYYEVEIKNPHLVPSRTVFVKVTLALP